MKIYFAAKIANFFYDSKSGHFAHCDILPFIGLISLQFQFWLNVEAAAEAEEAQGLVLGASLYIATMQKCNILSLVFKIE